MRVLRLLVVLAALFVAAADVAGRYAGEWKSNGGGGNGAFRMSVEPGAAGACKAEVTFDFSGTDVKTSVRECKIDGSKVDVTYDFDLMGNQLRSHVTGELKGDAIKGAYRTTSADGSPVDDGTWSALRQ